MKTVLFIEDDIGYISSMQEILEFFNAPFAVVYISSIKEATLWLSTDNADLIILDLNLPDSKEIHTILRLLKAAPTARIFVLTGIRISDLVERCYAIGAVEVMEKYEVAQNIEMFFSRVHALLYAESVN